MIRSFLSVLLLLFIPANGYSQDNAINDFEVTEGMPRFQQLSLNEGLLHNNVHSLFEDDSGFIWIGTSGGLQRYDGQNFQEYSSGQPNILSSATIREITQTADGTLWISQAGHGLSKLDFDQFTHFNSKENEVDGSTIKEVFCMFPNPDTSLWLGTDIGLILYRNQEFQTVLSEELGPVKAILRNDDGSLYLSLGESGLYYYNNHSLTKVGGIEKCKSAVGISFKNILKQGNGNILLVAEASKIFELDPTLDSAWNLSISPENIITCQVGKKNNLWIGSPKGLLEYRNGNFSRITENPGDPNGLSSNVILSSLLDSQGRLWLGTYGGGINILLDTGFGSIKYLPEKDYGLKNRVVKSLQIDDEGILWIGSQDNGLSILKGKRAFQPPQVSKIEGLKKGNIYTIYQDTKNNEWFCGPQGIFKHEKGKISKLDFKYDDAQAIIEQDSGVYWIADFIEGLSKLENGHLSYFDYDNGTNLFQSSKILTLNIGFENDLWIGYYNNGIDLVKNDRVTESFFYDQSDSTTLSNDQITCIFPSTDSIVWVGTNYGLNKYSYETHSFKRYFASDGLGSNTIQAINEDENGNLWISTIKGISRFDPIQEVFINYGLEDGVDAQPFSLYCTTKDKNTGRLYFGGENGITTFHPDSISLKSNPPDVEILDITILNKSISPSEINSLVHSGKTLELTYQQNIISIKFIAPNVPMVDYSFTMEGFDPIWNIEKNDPKITYTKLPPGNYSFKVKARTKNGHWGNVNSISIRITPPFWKKWWFRCFVLALSLFAILGVFKMRVRAIEKGNRLLKQEIRRRKGVQKELETKNAELERFTYTVSHDLKSPLITIRSFLGMIKEDLQQNNLEAIESDVLTIESASDKMKNLLDDLLEVSRAGKLNSNPEIIDTNKMIIEVIKLFDSNKEAASITFEVESNLPAIRGDQTRIFEVFQNLVGNAIKYMGDSPEKKVKIGCTQVDSRNTFYVSDTGVGIDKKFSTKIFDLFERLQPEIEGTGVGLAIVKRVVEVHNGKVWVESEGIGRGSTFYFTLPHVYL